MKKLLVILMALCMLFVLASCAKEPPTVLGASYDENGNLILAMSDGTTVNVGKYEAPDENPQGLEFCPLSDGTYGVRIGSAAFLNAVAVPDSYKGKNVTRILDFGSAAFERVQLPDTITHIEGNAFMGCKNLTAISLPLSVEVIGERAFSGCSKLATVDFGAGFQLTTIGDQAFQGTALTQVILPASVSAIGMGAFDCDTLESVTFANTTGWYVTDTAGATTGTAVNVVGPTANATQLKDTHAGLYWYRAA